MADGVYLRDDKDLSWQKKLWFRLYNLKALRLQFILARGQRRKYKWLYRVLMISLESTHAADEFRWQGICTSMRAGMTHGLLASIWFTHTANEWPIGWQAHRQLAYKDRWWAIQAIWMSSLHRRSHAMPGRRMPFLILYRDEANGRRPSIRPRDAFNMKPHIGLACGAYADAWWNYPE